MGTPFLYGACVCEEGRQEFFNRCVALERRLTMIQQHLEPSYRVWVSAMLLIMRDIACKQPDPHGALKQIIEELRIPEDE